MKKNLLLPFLLFISLGAQAQIQGPLNPSSFSYSFIGCLSCPGAEWQNMPNITITDNQYADVSLGAYPGCFQTSCYYSRYLFAFNFGFTIPQNSVILGVEAHILRKSTSGTGVQDTLVQLFSGAPVGSNHSSPLLWTPNPMNVTYGSSTDTWGYTLTPDTVNSPSFGLSVMVLSKNFTTLFTTASIDHLDMTVYYMTGMGIQSQTKSAQQFSLHYDSENHLLDLFSASAQKINSLKIADVAGHNLYRSATAFSASGVQKINLPVLSSGIYVAEMDVSGKAIRKKFIVQ